MSNLKAYLEKSCFGKYDWYYTLYKDREIALRGSEVSTGNYKNLTCPEDEKDFWFEFFLSDDFDLHSFFVIETFHFNCKDKDSLRKEINKFNRFIKNNEIEIVETFKSFVSL